VLLEVLCNPSVSNASELRFITVAVLEVVFWAVEVNAVAPQALEPEAGATHFNPVASTLSATKQ
jgi:hypothetical protein